MPRCTHGGVFGLPSDKFGLVLGLLHPGKGTLGPELRHLVLGVAKTLGLFEEVGGRVPCVTRRLRGGARGLADMVDPHRMWLGTQALTPTQGFIVLA